MKQRPDMQRTLAFTFRKAIRMLGNGIMELPAYLTVFGMAVGFLVVVLVVGHILIAAFNPSQTGERDERDLQIDWKAESRSSYIMGIGVLGALAALFAGFSPVWIAHILLHTLFVAELAKMGFQLYYYRKGI